MPTATGKGGAVMTDGQGAKRGKGTVFVSGEICKGCSYCIDFCPTDCLEFSHDFNAKGYHYPVLARPADCTGCDLCGLYCPDFAIFGMRFRDLEKRQGASPAEPSAPTQP
jgi:2-oxoglutarate ferredoxin oxidoreductase subunit delta